ncbi:MAG: hypothetical protein LC107_04600 [Chitinophagales bacterium]|nr:hypothetical protein [Chitinophagales bacterium]
MDTENIDIHAELAELSPLLSQISKEKEGIVPEGYFESVEEQISEQMAVILVDGQEERQVPMDYFESLEDKILMRMNHRQESANSPIIVMMTRTWVKMAAALVLILGAMILFNNQGQSNEPELTAVNDWDEQELWDFLIDNSDDISLMMLIDEGLVEPSDLIVSAE